MIWAAPAWTRGENRVMFELGVPTPVPAGGASREQRAPVERPALCVGAPDLGLSLLRQPHGLESLDPVAEHSLPDDLSR